MKKIFHPYLFKERKKFSHVPKGEIRNGAGAGLTCRTSFFKYCFTFFKRTKAKGKAGEACSLRHPRRGEVAGLLRSPENYEKNKRMLYYSYISPCGVGARVQVVLW